MTFSLWHLRTPARHHGPVPDQAIEHRSTDHPAVITGAQLSLISAKPSTATAAQTSNPHSRPGAHPPSRGFLLRRLSDAGPRLGCTRQRPAGVRNPSRERTGVFGRSECRSGHSFPHSVTAALDRGYATWTFVVRDRTSRIDVKRRFQTTTVDMTVGGSRHSTPAVERPVTRQGPIRTAWQAAPTLDYFGILSVWERLCRCRGWVPPPFNSRRRDHHDGDNERSDDDQPLDRSIVLIWIPTRHELDPVRKYWRD